MYEHADSNELESLREQVRKLEQRVVRLEHTTGLEPETSSTPQPMLVTASGEAMPQAAVFTDTASAVPILGRSLLALAGAYLLRALTEMGTIPIGFGITAGVAYATLWLGLAARTSPERKLASIMYSLASVLVLTPLIWEATVRFHVFTTAISALILTSFTIIGLVISWQRNLTHIAWIATLAGVLTAIGLMFATYDLMPFTFALLAIAAAVEASACLEHWLKERFWVAMAANMAVLLATYTITRPQGIPEGYAMFTAGQVIGAQGALLGIYLASAIVRTLWRGLPFTNVEVFQCAVAFVIGMGGSLRVAKGTAGETGLAIFTLFCALACYLVAFTFLERHGEHGRNFYIYSTFGLLLTMGGSGALLSATALGVALPLLALASVWVGQRWKRSTLYWHGTTYLLFGSLASGALGTAFGMLAATATGLAGIGLALICTGLCAGGCCLIVSRCEESHPANTVSIVLLASVLLGGIAAGALTSFVPVAYAAPLRTAVILATAAVLARGVPKAHRWSAITLMVLAGGKILTQEFRADATMPLFLSLFLYGGMLLVLPRILQRPKEG